MTYIEHVSLSVMSDGDAWIGGTDKDHQGTWVWSHFEDTFTYTNWNKGITSMYMPILESFFF